MMKWNRGIGLALAVSLLMTNTALGAGNHEESGWYEPVYHADVHYSDMKYEGFDRTELDRLLDELDMLCSSGETGHEEEIAELYEAIRTQYEWFDTQCVLNMLEYYKDITNEEAQEIDLEMTLLGKELEDKIFLVLKKASESPYGDVLKEAIGEDVEQLEDYEPMSDRELELWEEDSLLVQSYDQVMIRNDVVQVNGEEWTLEQYNEAPPEDEDENFQVYRELYKAKNKDAAAILQEMVLVRNEIAQLNGYDNFADYAYKEIYARDFSTEEIQSVYEEVKESVIPMYSDFLTAGMTVNYDALINVTEDKTGEEVLDELEPFIGQVHPELMEAFSYMRDYGLYDIEKSDTKLDMAFSTGLPSYGAAFVFSQPYENYGDYGTMIHEFGHYNQMFHDTQSSLWMQDRMDVYEIHSQGLEVLFYPYAEKMFGEGGEAFQYDTISKMLYVVREGCLYDEFQNSIYKNPGMTAEEINKEFMRISKEYGYNYREDQEQAYAWIGVHHTFQSPMYYIGYATSALAALDIWMESLENREEAVDKYMHLTALGGKKPFREIMDETGFQDIFQDGVIQEISEELREIMKVDEKVAEYEKSLEPDNQVPLIPVILGVAVIGIVAVVIFKKKNKQEETEQEQSAEG